VQGLGLLHLEPHLASNAEPNLEGDDGCRRDPC
jgi:hypothetical protein